MDTLCQGGKVGIKRTDDNAGMCGRGVMQANEMPSIERDHDPVLCHGKRQDIRIRNRLACSAALDRREDIVAQVPQGLHGWEGKVLVRITPRYRSRRFVGMNLVLDFLPVRTGIGPRIGKILGPQGGIAPQEVGFTGAQTLRLDQDPDGNTRADDTWLAPTDAWGALNPGKRIPKVADDPLEYLRFFCTGQRRQELLNFLQRMHDFVSVLRLQVPVVEQYTISSTLWWELTTRMDASG
jgi:hypothetical protein